MIHYNESGDQSAPLIVFIHGGGVSGWMWDKQVQYFTNYHCIVPDLPGHGQNVGSTTFSINESALKIIELIEAKRKNRMVTAVGFSLGAQVLIEMLSLRPNLLDTAIINSALVRPIPFGKSLASSMKLLLPLIKNRTFSKIQAKSMYIDDINFESYYQESLLIHKDTFTSVMHENMTYTIPDHFKNARSRILVTVGEREKSMMKKSLADLVNAHSKSTGLVIPKVGHGVPLAHPDYFNQLVEEWMHGRPI